MNIKKILSLVTVLLMAIVYLAVPVFGGEGTFEASVNDIKGSGYLYLDFTKYDSNAVLSSKTDVTYDGKNAVKIVPNPSDTNAGKAQVKIDGWSYSVEMNDYEYIAIEYMYVPSNGAEALDVPMAVQLKNNANKSNLVDDYVANGHHMDYWNSEGGIVANKWTYALIDVSSFSDYFKEGTNTHIITQMQVYPFGNKTLKSGDTVTISADQVVYISKIMFFKNRPVITSGTDADTISPTFAVSIDGESSLYAEGAKITLGEATMSEVNRTFKWYDETNNKYYDAGAEYTVTGNAVLSGTLVISEGTFTQSSANEIGDGYAYLDFTKFGAAASSWNMAAHSKVTYDGKNVLKIVPTPGVADNSGIKQSALKVDSYDYTSVPADFEKYKWFAVEYYYAPQNGKAPIDTKLSIHFKNNGSANLVSTWNGVAHHFSEDDITSGKWAYALVDGTSISDSFDTSKDKHILRQMHILPFGSENLQSTIKADDVFYISRVMLFENKPIITTGTEADTIAPRYRVSVNGGETSLYTKGSTIILPQAPEKENAEYYTFKWTDGTNTYDAGETYTVSTNAALTAEWTEIEYTVTVDGTENKGVYGDTITLGEKPAELDDSYTFLWYDETNSREYEAGAIYTITGDAVITARTEYIGAIYIPEGFYNAATKKYTVKLYMKNIKANTATFGVNYNTSVMTLDSFTHEYAAFGSVAGIDDYLDDRENGIYIDRWMATEAETTPYVDATSEKQLIGTFVFTMEDHDVFDVKTDFVEAVWMYKEGSYEEGHYLAVPHIIDYDTKRVPIIMSELTEIEATMYTVSGSVITVREDGVRPNPDNLAKIQLLNGNDIVAEVTEDADIDVGEIEYSFEALAGVYTLRVVKHGYIAYEKEITVSDTTTLPDIALIAGDIKEHIGDNCGDGTIGISDFVRVVRGFDSGSTEEYRKSVDLNEDGGISVTDLGYIKTNFGKTTESYD